MATKIICSCEECHPELHYGEDAPCDHKWCIEGDRWCCDWCGKTVDADNPDAMETAMQNIRDGWAALALIREAVEQAAPPGSVPNAEYLPEPTPYAEAQAI